MVVEHCSTSQDNFFPLGDDDGDVDGDGDDDHANILLMNHINDDESKNDNLLEREEESVKSPQEFHNGRLMFAQSGEHHPYRHHHRHCHPYRHHQHITIFIITIIITRP